MYYHLLLSSGRSLSTLPSLQLLAIFLASSAASALYASLKSFKSFQRTNLHRIFHAIRYINEGRGEEGIRAPVPPNARSVHSKHILCHGMMFKLSKERMKPHSSQHETTASGNMQHRITSIINRIISPRAAS